MPIERNAGLAAEPGGKPRLLDKRGILYGIGEGAIARAHGVVIAFYFREVLKPALAIKVVARPDEVV